MKIYFNPSCLKCRNAVSQLDRNGENHQLVHYLKLELLAFELSDIIDMLEDPLTDWVNEDRNFSELGLNTNAYDSKESIFELLQEHPKRMQRPIVVNDGNASIARTREKVDELAG